MKYILLLLLLAVGCSKSSQDSSSQKPSEIETVEFAAVDLSLPASGIFPDTNMDFATLAFNQSGTQTINITNRSGAAMVHTAQDFNTAQLAPFIIESNSCIGSIADRRRCAITLRVTNSTSLAQAQELSSILMIKTTTISLTGTLAAAPQVTTPPPVLSISASPSSLNFGSLVDAQSLELSIAVKNNGSSSTTIDLTPVTSSKLAISSNTCTAPLATRRSCTLKVKYTASGDEAITNQEAFKINNNVVSYSVSVVNPVITAPPVVVSVSPLTQSESISLTQPASQAGSVTFRNNGINPFSGPIVAQSSSPAVSISSISCASVLNRSKTCLVNYNINSSQLSLGANQVEIALKSGSISSAPFTLNLSIAESGTVEDVITYQPQYEAYGVCSVTLPCQGSGSRSRSYTCQKYINGSLDSTVANSFCSSVVVGLTETCLSPMGQISVQIDNGSKQVSCLQGSQIQAYVASSLSCDSGYVANESSQMCDLEVIAPSIISLIGQMKANSTGNSFFKIDDNYNISELATNTNQRTKSKGLSQLTFQGNDLLFMMDTDEYGTEVYRLNEGSNIPQLVTYDPSVLNRYGSANQPLVVHNGYAYFTVRTIDNSTLRCVAVDLNNYSNVAFFSSCGSLTVVNGSLYGAMLFDASTGIELVRFNGLNVELVADINPGPSNSGITRLLAVGNDLYFNARNPTVANTPGSGLEIFKYNTATNTVTTYDTIVGPTGAIITGLQVYNGYIFYREGNFIKRFNTANNQVSVLTPSGNHTQQLDADRFLGLGDSVYFASNSTGGLGTEMIRHVISTGVNTVVDLTGGSGSTTPVQIKTDGTNVFVRAFAKIFKYTVSNQQIQDLDLSSPSFGSINSIGAFNIDANNLYYVATQNSLTGFGTEFFKYSIGTGEKTLINICEDSVGACSGARSGFPQDIKIKNNDIYILGGNNLTGSNEIVKINNLNNSFEIIDANKMKMGIRNNEVSYPVEHIISDGKIFFGGENNNGHIKLFVKTIGSSSDAIEVNLPTPYLDNNPMNFYQSQNYVYFGAKTAQTESKVFQYNKLNGNVVAIDFPFNQSGQSSNYTAFDNGKYYLVADQGPIYVYDESTNQVLPNPIYVTYDASLDPSFDFSAWQMSQCQNDPGGPEGVQMCLDNNSTPPTPYIVDGNMSNPVVFNGVLYFTGAIHGWDSNQGSVSYISNGLYRYNAGTDTVTLLTTQTDSMNPNLRFSPLEAIKTENHVIWISQDFPQEVFHVYKDQSGNSVEETIQFMDTVSGYSSFPSFAIEDSQKDLYFTDPRSDAQLYKLSYGGLNSIITFAGQNVFDLQQLIQNEEITAGEPIRGILDLNTDILFQYGSKLLKCPKAPNICSVVPTPQNVTNSPIGGLYRLGNSVIYSQDESDSSYNIGDYEHKLYRLNLDDNSVTEILYNGDGVRINLSLKEYAE